MQNMHKPLLQGTAESWRTGKKTHQLFDQGQAEAMAVALWRIKEWFSFGRLLASVIGTGYKPLRTLLVLTT